MNELKPCPFCGAEPTMSWEHYLSGDEFYIRCENEKCLGASFQDADAEKAMDQWNTRQTQGGESK